MEVFNLNEDGEDPGIPEGLEERMNPCVIAFDYQTDCYDGSGTMIYYGMEGWESIDLGHCSCYGPGEYWCHATTEHDFYPTLDEMEKAEGESDLIDLLRAHGYR